MQTPKTNKPGSPAPASGETPDLARKFMREVPAGSMPDTEQRPIPLSAEVPIAEGGEVPETPASLFDQATPEVEASVETPVQEDTPATAASETLAAAAPGEAATPPTPQAEVPIKPEAQAAQPIAEVKPTEAAAAPASAEIPKLDPTAKYTMADGSEWTGQQVTDALYQRAEIMPKAAEADKFHALLGFDDYAKAEAQWKPFLERVAAASPAQREFAERMLAQTDPALLDYLQRSEQYFYSPEGGGFQRPAEPSAAAKPADDPRLTRFETVAREMEGQLAVARANNEKQQLFNLYPFLQHSQKARQAIFDRATEMFAADEAAGKPLMQRRGLLDAIEQNKVFLDTMAIAASQATRPAVEPRPASGAQALLPSSGPASNGGSTRAPRRESYNGDPEKARDQFLQDHPE